MALPTDPASRKQHPITRGCLDYFPDAIAEIAHLSWVANEQHNPGEELHWARDKSSDHADCLGRHLIERGRRDEDGMRHTAKLAWRALAMLQLEIETERQGETCTPPANELERGFFEVDADPPLWLKEADQRICWNHLVATGCSGKVATLISASIAVPPDHYQRSVDPERETGRAFTYVAGPMRGIKDFNFPAFDRARDVLRTKYECCVISPADIDRQAGGLPSGEITPEHTHEFIYRDYFALRLLNPTSGDFLTVLPGWEASTGACSEVFLARWMGLPIREFRPWGGAAVPLIAESVDWVALRAALETYLRYA